MLNLFLKISGILLSGVLVAGNSSPNTFCRVASLTIKPKPLGAATDEQRSQLKSQRAQQFKTLSPTNTCIQNPRLSGSLIQMDLPKDWNQDQWNAELQRMKNAC